MIQDAGFVLDKPHVVAATSTKMLPQNTWIPSEVRYRDSMTLTDRARRRRVQH